MSPSVHIPLFTCTALTVYDQKGKKGIPITSLTLPPAHPEHAFTFNFYFFFFSVSSLTAVSVSNFLLLLLL